MTIQSKYKLPIFSVKQALLQQIRQRVIAPLLCKPLSKYLIPILGCQRSGTTLIFLILKVHPQIKGLDEDTSHFSFSNYSSRRLAKNALSGYFSCFKLPKAVAEVNDIVQYYPHSKIIWPIRHPYAVISSMRSLRMGEAKNWLSQGAIPELVRMSKIFPEIKSLNLSQLDEIYLGAYVWKYKIFSLAKYKSLGLNVFDFKYEDLLENTKVVLGEILSFIGLEWSERVLQHERYNDLCNRKVFVGGSRADKPLDKTRKAPVLRLSQTEIERIEAICGECMSSYGYKSIVE